MSNLIYSVSDKTEINLPSCIITPSYLVDSTTVTLISFGESEAPSGFATVNKNADKSYKISLFSKDPLIDGKEY